ncbi:PP2C family protein-serine/threonine phosphatase [Streptomyces marincola]|uniref:PP2C family protein-serine/threonine phosphatase n=1 Tax=Streptomyces marincola TaxID=2878388 RepID=UPI00210020D0|nr:PP2C family protein-serine/threonine phosphatase [Streptomyces marincola]
MQTSAPPWWARARLLTWLPAVLIAIGTVLDLASPPHVTLTPFYVAAPLLVAPVLSLRVTVGYGTLATGVVAAQMAMRAEPHLSESVVKVVTVALISLLALAINRIVARRDRRVASARDVARIVQRAVVPAPPGEAGALRVAARYRPARRDTLIGGDLYALRETPFGVRMLVGDVRGKGLAATETVAVLLGAFREAAERERDLSAVANRMEAALVRERTTRLELDPIEGFATAVLVEMPPGPPHRVRVFNRGHPPPVLMPEGARARFLTTDPALPLGLGDLGPARTRPRTARFPPGAGLLLYTDGLSEARNAVGVFFDIVAGLDGLPAEDPAECLDSLVDRVIAYAGGALDDDMALLAVAHVPGGAVDVSGPAAGPERSNGQ